MGKRHRLYNYFHLDPKPLPRLSTLELRTSHAAKEMWIKFRQLENSVDQAGTTWMEPLEFWDRGEILWM